ncbi:MAG: sulfatase-like hydrolase/transferase, partial [Bacteroidota bacterium]
PFFLAVGFLRPHTPLVAPQKYFDRFPLEQLDLAVIHEGDEKDTHLTESYKGDVFTLTMGKRMFQAIQDAYGSREEGLKRWTQAYLACVAAVDENIGTVLEALDNSPLKENTLVVIASDHGFHMGEKDYLYKNSLWEESTRVPLLMRVPGLTSPGTTVNRPISLIHLYPTLMDLCGLSYETAKNEKGHGVDGYSLRPLLDVKNPQNWEGPKAALTVVYAGSSSKSEPAKQHYALRSHRYRYIRYNNGKEEIYDHKQDPYETHNLVHRKKGRVKKLRKSLFQRVPSL